MKCGYRVTMMLVAAILTACVDETPGEPVTQEVESVTVAPTGDTLLEGSQLQLSATVRDADGEVLTDRTVHWSTSDSAIATVDASGLVTAVGHMLGRATINAQSEGKVGEAEITVVVTFTSLAAGGNHSCGITTSGAMYCWGWNGQWALGDGSHTDRTAPAKVIGELTFRALGAATHTCGVATNTIYCWGPNFTGELGDGTLLTRDFPKAVIVGLGYESVSLSSGSSCGVTGDGVAYCWGDNHTGQLGAVTVNECGPNFTPCSTVPLIVSGGLTFQSVSIGSGHSCGVTTTGAAYCWGWNLHGQLGDGSTTDRSTPVAVTGGLTFASVGVGSNYTCGLSTGGTAYCWGANFDGTLGDGTTTPHWAPAAVSGGLNFVSLSIRRTSSCGVTADGAAYCWGTNEFGQLGIGMADDNAHATPEPVSGGLMFASVSVGFGHACGLTADGIAYCWGWNAMGQVGDGTTNQRVEPVRVMLQK